MIRHLLFCLKPSDGYLMIADIQLFISSSFRFKGTGWPKSSISTNVLQIPTLPMLIQTKGIVLRSVKYSETSVITDIFTEESGLRSYIISGVRSQKSKVSAGLLQIMTPVEIIAYHREDRDLSRIKEIKASHVYQSLPFDVRKSAVGMFMVEIARKAIQGNEEHQELFQCLLDNFIFLDQTNRSFANLHLHFMLDLTGYLGFQPGGQYDEITPLFDLQEGLFTGIRPQHPYSLTASLAEKLSELIHLPKEQCHEVRLNREERKALLNNLLLYFRLHIEHFPPIHSHEILEEVLL